MKTHPFWKAAALAALLVPLPAGAQPSDRADGTRFVPNVVAPFQALTEFADPLLEKIRAGNNPGAIAFLRQAPSWPQKAPADSANVGNIANIADIAALTALLEQVVKSLSAA